MDKGRQGRIRIGLSMPQRVPARLHAPMRLALGLGLGAAFALYAAAVAILADRVVTGAGPDGDRAWGTDLAVVAALVAGGWLLRAALRLIPGHRR